MTLRVTLEIVPYGAESSKYTISTMDIYNQGNAGLGLHYYGGQVRSDGETILCKLVDKSIEHNRQDGAWALVKKNIEAYGNKLS